MLKYFNMAYLQFSKEETLLELIAIMREEDQSEGNLLY
jgi:hypothetical protein